MTQVSAFASLSVVLFVTFSSVIPVDSASDKALQWRKTLCEKKDEKLYEALQGCCKLRPQMFQDAVKECSTEAGFEDPKEMMCKGCDDESVFQKFDECFEKYESDAAFKEQAKLTGDARECAEGVLKEFNLDLPLDE